jgi:hypothetical protein
MHWRIGTAIVVFFDPVDLLVDICQKETKLFKLVRSEPLRPTAKALEVGASKEGR